MYELNFIQLLDIRKQLKRKNDNENIIKLISYNIVHILSLEKEEKNKSLLIDNLNEAIQYILNDCEPYLEMDKNKALDSLIELSNLASIYSVIDNNIYYYEINKLIKTLIVSYNLNNFN